MTTEAIPMLRRRRAKISKAEVAEQTEQARRAADEARAAREAVHASTSEIMGEVKEHARLLKENNFARRISRALGGAGG